MQVDPGNDYQRALVLLKEAGFTWAKEQVRWEDLEPEEGNIRWNVIDWMVNEANDMGISLLLSVVTAPRWARDASSDFSYPGPPADSAGYARFVSLMLQRYPGKIAAVEVWNEQNLWSEWGGMGKKIDANQYVELLEAAYNAVKSVDPDVIVVSGAPTPTGVDDGHTAIEDARYLEMMYQAGLRSYSDAIGVHPAGYNNPPDDTPSKASVTSTGFKGHWSFYFRRLEQYRAVMERYGDGKKKLWLTEFGWASSSNPPFGYAYARDNSEDDQANYLVRAFQMAREKDYIGGMFVWNLNFAPGAEPDDRQAKRAFSILRSDWSPRPAYVALKAMSK